MPALAGHHVIIRGLGLQTYCLRYGLLGCSFFFAGTLAFRFD
jgi:hypothetical protein